MSFPNKIIVFFPGGTEILQFTCPQKTPSIENRTERNLRTYYYF